eukprot:COSAG05_NODE_2522_length_2948_cov_1.656020_1_plen_76_part_00
MMANRKDIGRLTVKLLERDLLGDGGPQQANGQRASPSNGVGGVHTRGLPRLNAVRYERSHSCGSATACQEQPQTC